MHKLAMIIATIFSVSIPPVPVAIAVPPANHLIVGRDGIGDSTGENDAVPTSAVLTTVSPVTVLQTAAGKPAAIALQAAAMRSLHHLAGKWTKDVLHAARKAHISPRLLASVLHVENRGAINESAHRVSSSGAIGPMQLMPTTAWDDLRVNPWNPKENINGGAQYLASLIRQFSGSKRLALIAYNAGPGAVAGGARPECAVLYADAVLRYAG
ncbi:transglycosylase SLT domain-containing protein [Acidithiobacillus ferrivorans]|uniref:transglycosylase SLT domain-containing protein n=1 Tax=Acidithiobacillus ferrivorans TaxID=160808 RepID=UPI00068E2AA2|nr:transglycosylase SLT domain-containing protein [Acidithiobacillus ferrivorans]